MGFTIRTMTTVMGRSGKPERPSFFPIRAHLLTTCEAGGGIPPSGRAVRSARRIALSAESARQCRRACGVGRHCLCGWQTAVASFASSLQIVVPIRDNLPPACENLPPAALPQRWTMPSRTVHFLLYAPKETKTPPCGEQKGRDPLWRSIIWKLRS